MVKTVLLIVLAVGIGSVGFRIYSVSSLGNSIENFSPDYPGSSEIPLYEGDSLPKEIPPYENNAGIIPLNPTE